jgi:hypothetical protein
MMCVERAILSLYEMSAEHKTCCVFWERSYTSKSSSFSAFFQGELGTDARAE